MCESIGHRPLSGPLPKKQQVEGTMNLHQLQAEFRHSVVHLFYRTFGIFLSLCQSVGLLVSLCFILFNIRYILVSLSIRWSAS